MNKTFEKPKPHILYVTDADRHVSTIERRMVLRAAAIWGYPRSRRDIDLGLDHSTPYPKGSMEEACDYAWALYSLGSGLVIAGSDRAAARLEALDSYVREQAPEHSFDDFDDLHTYNLGRHNIFTIAASYPKGLGLVRFTENQPAFQRR